MSSPDDIDKRFEKAVELLDQLKAKGIDPFSKVSKTFEKNKEIRIINSEWDKENVLKNLIKLSEIITDDTIGEISWLIENIIVEHGITIIAAPPKAWKSYIALYIAICVACDNLFLNQFKVRKGKVLYIDEENSLIIIKQRAKALTNEENKADEENKIKNYYKNIDILSFKNVKLTKKSDVDYDWIEKLRKLIDKATPDLIIIDSLVRVLDGNENNSEDVKIIYESIKLLRKEHPEITWLLLHHTRKNDKQGQEGLRGSGDFVAQVDIVIKLDLLKDGGIVFSQVANRCSKNIRPFKITPYVHKDKLGEEHIDFLYSEFDNEKDENKAEECANEIIKIVKEQKMKEFSHKQMQEKMKAGGFKQNAFYDALEILKQRGLLDKRRGKSEVNLDKIR